MGLLDAFEDPGVQLGLGLLAAGGPSAVPMSPGQRIAGAFQQFRQQRAEEEQRKVLQQFRQMQMAQMQAETEEKQRARALAEQQQRFLMNIVSPVSGGQAASMGGGPTNAATEIIGTTPKLTPDVYRQAIALGIPAERVKALAESGTWGKPEVHSVETIMTPDGPQRVAYSKQGEKIGVFGPKAPDVPWYVNYKDGKPSYEAGYTAFELGKANAGATRVLNNINAYAPFNEKLQGDMAGDLVKNYGTLRDAPLALQNIERVKELAPKAFTGTFGEAKLNVSKVLKEAGIPVDVAKINSTEELRSALFVQVMENLKKMDAQPSQYQQIQMQNAFGTLGTDPASLPKIMDVYGDILRGKVTEHNTRVQQAQNNGAKFAYDVSIKLPETNSKRTPQSIPQAAVNELRLRKGDAKARQQFDAIFGPGSADSVLGGQ